MSENERSSLCEISKSLVESLVIIPEEDTENLWADSKLMSSHPKPIVLRNYETNNKVMS